MSSPLVRATNLRKSYGALPVLKGIDISVQSGEVIAIVGASGAGKSTLLHILGTLDKPDEGSLHIRDTDVLAFPPHQMAGFRNASLGFVFQFHNLLPEFTALENVMMPALIAGKDKSTVEKKANELLNLLGINSRAQHKPSELSGGEQQRTAVARALINDPALVLADEPSGNLDSANAAELHKLFFDLRDSLRQTLIIVTHNKEFAAMADRTIVLKDGLVAG